MISKKGQVSDQFNWIFAIIAGGVILLFFLFLIGQLKSVSDNELAITVINNFDAVITGSLSTPNTLNKIDSTDSLSFQVICDSSGVSEMTISGSTAKVDLSQKVVFSPRTISGDSLFIYTIPIQKPFYITNSLLITEPKTLFLFIPRGENIAGLDKIKNLFPEELSVMSSNIIHSEYSRYEKIIIISDVTPRAINRNQEYIPGESALINKEVNWIKVDFGNNNVPVSADFFSKKSRSNNFEHEGNVKISDSNFILFLAFSRDLDFYDCNFNKVSRRMKTISEIYLKRTERIQSEMVSNLNCAARYLSAKQIFNDLVNSHDVFNEHEKIVRLENLNRALLLASCPLVY